MKKRLIKFIFIFAIFIFLINISSALLVGPAKVEYNFEPGLETSVTYFVSHPDPETEFELYVAGDLSDFVTLNKDKLVGGGGFTAIINLPLYIEKPGKHRILIGVKEKIDDDDEEVVTMIRTSVTIQAVIDIYVPYPGRYIDILLSSYNVNVGEPIDFKLDISSQGKEDVNVTPKIGILFNNETIDTLFFANREIKSQEKITLKKTLDTTNYNPGSYNALAIVDYGGLAKSEAKFSIGELTIRLVDYTKQIPIGGLNRFDMNIESGWNNEIDGAYAEVSIFNSSDNLISFKTSSTNLKPWEKKRITGFFDTSNFTKGIYDANITFIYYGKDVGKSSSELVQVEFLEKESNLQAILIFIGAVLLFIVLFIIKRYFLKNEK